MPKHSVITEYKWVILAMLGDAKLPYIGSAKRLLLRGRTTEDGLVIVHVNLPWLLEGHDTFDLPARRNTDRWGWEIVSFWCAGQKLIVFGSSDPDRELNMANPESNQKLVNLVTAGIEEAHVRQIKYAEKKQ
jgi:hypothetical protein